MLKRRFIKLIEYVNVNIVKILALEALPSEKAKGEPKGSKLIISYDCELHPECRKYCDLNEIKIVRFE
ncbi:hypothetical protein OD350_03685 [Clostridium beijerinckii]|uniref:hypothetical protein n=1 Tax=Clostridium beijerinckii TaxID=1520 RepID=UPI002226F5F2|nr:hypothetical protein [Clostridium beijerinckii]UYZ36784.1 hypothetical protein OD350_03685 [Clostridium beijerinckii]